MYVPLVRPKNYHYADSKYLFTTSVATTLQEGAGKRCSVCTFWRDRKYTIIILIIIIIIVYIYHALINALSAHMMHIDLNMIFYTHVDHSPTKTIDIKYYTEKKQQQKRSTHTHIHTHTHTHIMQTPNTDFTTSFLQP